ncbi:MAG TPA: N,N-dimethylformamidase beta subunit family domain-containing protein [Ktedonobacterales bacterium]|nr:N,N-dimethylformamidase beta subunit family domain-containing protein [Ktedonobacterales bacterium]
MKRRRAMPLRNGASRSTAVQAAATASPSCPVFPGPVMPQQSAIAIRPAGYEYVHLCPVPEASRQEGGTASALLPGDAARPAPGPDETSAGSGAGRAGFLLLLPSAHRGRKSSVRVRHLFKRGLRDPQVGYLLLSAMLLTLLISSGLDSSRSGAPKSVFTHTAALIVPSCQNAAQAANPIAAENTCPGTASWRPDHPMGRQDAIEAFTDPVSVNVGQTVHLYVSTMAPTYSLYVYRLGWYQGLGGRLMWSAPRVRGIRQPAPTVVRATRMVSCSTWRDPVALAIPTSWVSGIYLVKLVSSQGYLRYTTFTVRNDANQAPILVQSSVLTYQAYNDWGGYSLYLGLTAPHKYSTARRSYVVSFDRPYAENAGLSDFASYEFDLVRWVEWMRYDVSYITDVDTDQNASLLLHHGLLLIAGHDEYWSTAMRAHVTAARDAGVSLAFFGGNDLYWHVRLQRSPLGPDREVVCYRVASLDPLAAKSPAQATVTWGAAPLGQPASTLLGQTYGGIVAGPVPLILGKGAQFLLTGTSLRVGEALPGLVSGEFDRVVPNAPAPATRVILASSPVTCTGCPGGKSVANATLYTAPSGAKVFDAGTFQWQWGLDDTTFFPASYGRFYSNVHFQQLTANLIAYLLAR